MSMFGFHKSFLVLPSSQYQTLYSESDASSQGEVSPNQQVTGNDVMLPGFELGNQQLLPTASPRFFLDLKSSQGF